MTGRRLSWCGAVAALLTVCSGAPAATAAGVPALAADTVIDAPRPATRMTVRLPKSVRLPGACFPAPEIAVTGTADVVVLTLTPHPYKVGDSPIVIGRLPRAAGGRGYDSLCVDRTVPAGTYDLAVVHGPGTARVRLRLPGLSGRTVLRPTRTAAARLAVLPRLATPADAALASGQWGRRDQLAGRGMTIATAWFDATAPLASVFGDCLLGPGGPAVPDAVAFAPGCPVGESALSYGFRTGGTTYLTASTANIPAGSYGVGVWYAGPAGTLRTGGGIGVWLPFA